MDDDFSEYLDELLKEFSDEEYLEEFIINNSFSDDLMDYECSVPNTVHEDMEIDGECTTRNIILHSIKNKFEDNVKPSTSKCFLVEEIHLDVQQERFFESSRKRSHEEVEESSEEEFQTYSKKRVMLCV